MSIELVMPSNHPIFCCPLLLLPFFFPSIKVLSNEWALHIRWPKYWGFSFSINPSNEYSGLISFRIDWFDFTAQGTCKNLLQHRNSKVPILWLYLFMVQLSYLYITTRKAIPLTIWSFVGQVMSLLFNTLSRFVIVFLPRSVNKLKSTFFSDPSENWTCTPNHHPKTGETGESRIKVASLELIAGTTGTVN